MTASIPQHRLARLGFGRALVAVVILALIFTIWRQAEQIETLTQQNQYLREKDQTPQQAALVLKARLRAEQEILN